ncbi:Intracellular distribution of mitochondria [Entophlyctis luteolus]|nr:Intracellular distribution of mitochondria [Entophlyctis luteolus]
MGDPPLGLILDSGNSFMSNNGGNPNSSIPQSTGTPSNNPLAGIMNNPMANMANINMMGMGGLMNMQNMSSFVNPMGFGQFNPQHMMVSDQSIQQQHQHLYMRQLSVLRHQQMLGAQQSQQNINAAATANSNAIAGFGSPMQHANPNLQQLHLTSNPNSAVVGSPAAMMNNNLNMAGMMNPQMIQPSRLHQQQMINQQQFQFQQQFQIPQTPHIAQQIKAPPLQDAKATAEERKIVMKNLMVKIPSMSEEVIQMLYQFERQTYETTPNKAAYLEKITNHLDFLKNQGQAANPLVGSPQAPQNISLTQSASGTSSSQVAGPGNQSGTPSPNAPVSSTTGMNSQSHGRSNSGVADVRLQNQIGVNQRQSQLQAPVISNQHGAAQNQNMGSVEGGVLGSPRDGGVGGSPKDGDDQAQSQAAGQMGMNAPAGARSFQQMGNMQDRVQNAPQNQHQVLSAAQPGQFMFNPNQQLGMQSQLGMRGPQPQYQLPPQLAASIAAFHQKHQHLQKLNQQHQISPQQFQVVQQQLSQEEAFLHQQLRISHQQFAASSMLGSPFNAGVAMPSRNPSVGGSQPAPTNAIVGNTGAVSLNANGQQQQQQQQLQQQQQQQLQQQQLLQQQQPPNGLLNGRVSYGTEKSMSSGALNSVTPNANGTNSSVAKNETAPSNEPPGSEGDEASQAGSAGQNGSPALAGQGQSDTRPESANAADQPQQQQQSALGMTSGANGIHLTQISGMSEDDMNEVREKMSQMYPMFRSMEFLTGILVSVNGENEYEKVRKLNGMKEMMNKQYEGLPQNIFYLRPETVRLLQQNLIRFFNYADDILRTQNSHGMNQNEQVAANTASAVGLGGDSAVQRQENIASAATTSLSPNAVPNGLAVQRQGSTIAQMQSQQVQNQHQHLLLVQSQFLAQQQSQQSQQGRPQLGSGEMVNTPNPIIPSTPKASPASQSTAQRIPTANGHPINMNQSNVMMGSMLTNPPTQMNALQQQQMMPAMYAQIHRLSNPTANAITHSKLLGQQQLMQLQQTQQPQQQQPQQQQQQQQQPPSQTVAPPMNRVLSTNPGVAGTSADGTSAASTLNVIPAAQPVPAAEPAVGAKFAKAGKSVKVRKGPTKKQLAQMAKEKEAQEKSSTSIQPQQQQFQQQQQQQPPQQQQQFQQQPQQPQQPQQQQQQQQHQEQNQQQLNQLPMQQRQQNQHPLQQQMQPQLQSQESHQQLLIQHQLQQRLQQQHRQMAGPMQNHMLTDSAPKVNESQSGVNVDEGSFWNSSSTESSIPNHPEEEFGDFFDLSPPASPSKDSARKRIRDGEEDLGNTSSGSSNGDHLENGDDSVRNVKARMSCPTPNKTEKADYAEHSVDLKDEAEQGDDDDFFGLSGQRADDSYSSVNPTLDEELEWLSSQYSFACDKHFVDQAKVMVICRSLMHGLQFTFTIGALDRYQKLPVCESMGGVSRLPPSSEDGYFPPALESFNISGDVVPSLAAVVDGLHRSNDRWKIRSSHVVESCCRILGDNSRLDSAIGGTGSPAPAGTADHEDVGNAFFDFVEGDVQSPAVLKLAVPATAALADIKAHIADSPDGQFNTCFYLAFRNERLPDTITIADIPNFDPSSDSLSVVTDEYNDREIRVQIARLREIVTCFRSSTTSSVGVDVGISYLQDVSGDFALVADTDEKPKSKSTKKATQSLPFSSATFDDGVARIKVDGGILPRRHETRNSECLKSLTISCWNPPPPHRCTAGDIMYLAVTTNEAATFHIVCSVNGFYVSRSTDKHFDPAPKGACAFTLPALLSQISPQFKTLFADVHAAVQKRHPHTYLLPSTEQSFPWVVAEPNYSADPSRTVDVVISYADNADALATRDWNDDLCSTAALPTATANERVVRAQSLHRVYSEFVDAATKGAVAIVQKSLAGALGAGSGDDASIGQMYLNAGIFYSFARDQGESFVRSGGSAAAHVAVSKDVDGVARVDAVCGSLGIDVNTLGTCVVDYKGLRIIAQSVIPGILKRQQQQFQSKSVVSKGAEENQAQEEETKADVPDLIAYGSIDSGKSIFSRAEFHSIAEKVANVLHLDLHKVTDAAGNGHELYLPLDVKGIIGNDGRKYLLDLGRLTPLDIEFLEACDKECVDDPSVPSYPHRIPMIRHELVEMFYEHQLGKHLQEKALVDTSGAEAVDSDEVSFDVKFNPDAFFLTPEVGGSDLQSLEKQQENVKEMSRFLGTTVVPAVDLLVEEMTARAAKAVLRDLLQEVPLHFSSECIARFLTCLFGNAGGLVEAEAGEAGTKVYSYQQLTPASVNLRVRAEIVSRFRYRGDILELGAVRKLPLLRSICKKVGIQLKSKEYFKDGSFPTVETADVLNLYPVAKYPEPKCVFGDEIFEHAMLTVKQGERQVGQEVMSESLNIFEQAFGPIHGDAAKVQKQLALMHHENGEYDMCKLNLGYFECLTNNQEVGFKYMAHALKYLQLHCAENLHPELAAAEAQIGMLLFEPKVDVQSGLRFLESAVKVYEKVLGLEHNTTIRTHEIFFNSLVKAGDWALALDAHTSLHTRNMQKFTAAVVEAATARVADGQDADDAAVAAAEQKLKEAEETGAKVSAFLQQRILMEEGVSATEEKSRVAGGAKISNGGNSGTKKGKGKNGGKAAAGKENASNDVPAQGEEAPSKGHLSIDELLEFIDGAAKRGASGKARNPRMHGAKKAANGNGNKGRAGAASAAATARNGESA